MDPNSQSGSAAHIPTIPHPSTLDFVLPLALSGYEALEETAPTSMSGTLLQGEDFDISALDFLSITGGSEYAQLTTVHAAQTTAADEPGIYTPIQSSLPEFGSTDGVEDTRRREGFTSTS